MNELLFVFSMAYILLLVGFLQQNNPNSCSLTTKELAGETIRLHTCMRCPNNYPWLNDPTGDGFF